MQESETGGNVVGSSPQAVVLPALQQLQSTTHPTMYDKKSRHDDTTVSYKETLPVAYLFWTSEYTFRDNVWIHQPGSDKRKAT